MKTSQTRIDETADALIAGVLSGAGGTPDADSFYVGLLELASACAPLLMGKSNQRARAAKRLYRLAKKGGLQHVATN